jgi:hypothetical protein
MLDGELRSDSAVPAPEVLKAIFRANQNNAGICGAVTRIGRLAVGQGIPFGPGDREKGAWGGRLERLSSERSRFTCYCD